MDVDKNSFYPLLLDILTDISEAHFVALDLELSGVPSKASAFGGKDSGKSTLAQRYLETKEAAERYQILQIGLTCVKQDVAKGSYVLKPYNFDLSPVIDERGLDIERIFSFQSGAAEFLLKSGFDMHRPFAMGVPYLSREETKLARELFAKRQDRGAVADIQIKPTETESLAFLERVRNAINAWVKCKKLDTPDYLNITPIGFETFVDGNRHVEELSRFEKRLVHQLVRAEYPQLVSLGKKGFVQIVAYDKQREDRIAAERKRDTEERIGRQKGFRWVLEALLGSNIANIDLRECAKNSVTGEPVFADVDQYKAQFNRAQALMRGNPRILVVHNGFLDLVYVYRTFIGQLPETVEEFQEKLHKLWPVVVDTKYMSTHNCGDINPASSLEQIATQLSGRTTPQVETDSHHTKYANVEAFHEAGYDSFLTAQVAVRLSAKLEQEGAYVDVKNLDGPNDISNGIAAANLNETSHELVENGDPDDSRVEVGGFKESTAGAKWKGKGDETLGEISKDDLFQYQPGRQKRRHVREEVSFESGMPRFGSDFWRVYGNKLRVFGTQEGVCVLDGPTDGPMSDDGGVNL